MLDAEKLEIVDYEFTIEDGIGEPWEVRRIHLAEGLSRPFELQLELLTQDVGADTEAMVGASCRVEILRGSLMRNVAGVVKAAEYVGVSHDSLLVRLEIVPAFELLRHQVDSRIFQDMTSIQVVEEVLGTGLGDYNRKVDAGELRGHYDKRDYCVQFRESNFDFVSRLLEDEGITYRFDYDEENEVEKMVLLDDNATFSDIETLAGDELPISTRSFEAIGREALTFLDWKRAKRTNAVVSRGFNWKAPPTLDEADAEYDGPKGRSLELYDHEQRRHVVDDASDEGFDGTTQQREAIARRRMEMFASQTRIGRGRGNVTGFAPGMVFTLGEHPRADLDGGRYLITRVFHTGDCPDREVDVPVGERYLNSFECIPAEQPFRPPQTTPRPSIYGAQTAIVTGPDGEEIHTDKHGRIKVWFPWDRLQGRDEHSSCWVRTMQSWAGKSFGAWVLPRVGMEVVVTFLDGNPDRPMVTGCVYNGDNPVPYTMPDEKSKSTFKTESTPGGDGFNELRFEDAKDKEEIFLHAQKDLTIKVLNDTNTTIDHEETHHVGGDRRLTVVGNHFIEVQGKPSGGGSFKGAGCNVTGDYKVTASNTAYMSAPSSITLECPGSSIKLEPGKITLSAGPGASVVLDANALVKSAAGSELFLDGNALTKSSGGSSVLLDGNACMSASGGGSVLLDANAKISGGGATALYDGNATIKGGVATVVSTAGGCLNLTANADLSGATTTCAGGGGSCTLDGGGAKLSGGKVDIGGGVVNIG